MGYHCGTYNKFHNDTPLSLTITPPTCSVSGLLQHVVDLAHDGGQGRQVLAPLMVCYLLPVLTISADKQPEGMLEQKKYICS